MIYRFLACCVLCMLGLFPLTAQEHNEDKILVSGMVTDVEGKPMKDVMVFVDSVKTKIKTNRKGLYKIKLSPKARVVTVYSPTLGVLSMDYKGQTKIGFVYTRENSPVSEEDLAALGFSLYPEPRGKTDWYADFSSILEILDKRFYNVRVTNGKIIIGKGPSRFHGESDPLVLVNDQIVNVSALSSIATSDVKLIRVIHRGSEAANYGGLRAANGVVLVTLKE